MGFVIIALVSVLWAMYENSHLDMTQKEYRSISFVKLWIRLLTRGYIANFTLLDFRTTTYSGNKWLDESDEHPRKKQYLSPAKIDIQKLTKEPDMNQNLSENNHPEANFRIQNRHSEDLSTLIQQLWFYAISLTVNLAMIYSWYKIESSYGYFKCGGSRKLFVALVIIGAPLSSLLSIIFFSLRDFAMFSSFSLTAMQATHSRMKELIKRRQYIDLLKLIRIFRKYSEQDLRSILRVRSEDEDIIDCLCPDKEGRGKEKKESIFNALISYLGSADNDAKELLQKAIDTNAIPLLEMILAEKHESLTNNDSIWDCILEQLNKTDNNERINGVFISFLKTTLTIHDAKPTQITLDILRQLNPNSLIKILKRKELKEAVQTQQR